MRKNVVIYILILMLFSSIFSNYFYYKSHSGKNYKIYLIEQVNQFSGNIAVAEDRLKLAQKSNWESVGYLSEAVRYFDLAYLEAENMNGVNYLFDRETQKVFIDSKMMYIISNLYNINLILRDQYNRKLNGQNIDFDELNKITSILEQCKYQYKFTTWQELIKANKILSNYNISFNKERVTPIKP